MKRNLLVLYAVVALLPLASGCYGRKLVNVPNTVDQTRIDVEELRRQQEETMRMVRQLEARLDENTVFLRQLRADTGSLFADLMERLQTIEGRTEESVYRFGRLSEKVDEMRFSPKAAPDALGTAPDTAVVSFSDAQKAYRDAYLDLNAGNYDLAQMGFEEFLRNFPDSELSDNAQYWIGECHYAKEQYQEAAAAFKKVLDTYPDGDKIPSALLKLSYCSLALGDNDQARVYLTQIVERFPLSEEARLAEEKLHSLSQ
ncbi:MAG: tol-pal system protein YbgF [Candidatus Eisenbacteria bacterium]